MQVIGLCRFSYPAIGGFQREQGSVDARKASQHPIWPHF